MTRSGRRTLYLAGAALLVIALVGGRWLALETVERAWDRTFPGGEALIQARALARLLQLLVALFAAVWATGNLLIVYRSIGSVQMPRRLGDLEIVEAVSHRVLLWLTIVTGILLGILLSLGTGDWWRHALLAASPPQFGIADQSLGHDAGYYVGVLPWRATLQNRALVLVVGVLVAVALLYAFIGSLRVRRGRVRASDHARTHCGFLLAALALVIAWGAILDPAEVVAGMHGPIDQAALSVRLPAAEVIVAIAVITAIISVVWAWRDRPNLIVGGWAALIFSLVAGYAVIPGVVRASASSEAGNAALAGRRAPLERAAFGLTDVLDAAPPAFASGEAAVAATALWDPARVSAAAGAPAGGDGVALRPSAPGGPPSWLIGPSSSNATIRIAVESDTAAGGLAIRELPRTDTVRLFAPGAHGTAVVPADSGPAALRAAGITLSGWWRRFALAWSLQVWDLLREESRGRLFLYRRDVLERLDGLAPFARFETPKPAIVEGTLWWVSWGYVSHASFPLTRSLTWREEPIRYLRPGVIGAVRAATGESHVWLAPGYDSLTAAWARHFEPLIEPSTRIPESVRTQLAYPRDAFEAATRQIVRRSQDSTPATAWTARPARAFQLNAPSGELWTGVAFESGAPKRFEGLAAGTMTAEGPRLHFWRADDRPRRLPGELVGSSQVRPGGARIWPVASSIITLQAQFADPVGVTPAPAPHIAEVYVSLDGRNGRGLSAREALRGGEAAVTDTSLSARWLRARRLATQADSALGAGDLEAFGRLWRALLRELAPVPRPR